MKLPDVAAALRGRGVSGVDGSSLARAAYSSDASLYRVLPLVVVRPAHVDELAAIRDVAGEMGVPVTMRGAGTSVAGNAVGTGIVVDTRDLARILQIDVDARRVKVEPGVVHADLQRAVRPYGLRFGPDPSTHSRCTIGGMIGNNACGSRALGYGRTADNVDGMSVLFGTGGLEHLRGGRVEGPVSAGLAAVGDANLARIRTRFGQFERQVSGYALEHLLPERRALDRFVAGSEGTLAIVTQATLVLVEDQPAHLLVLGFGSAFQAADVVPEILAAGTGRLTACEGFDSRLVQGVRRTGRPVPELPQGNAWLFVEATGDDAPDVLHNVAAVSEAIDARVITQPIQAAQLWRLREDGAGFAASAVARPAYPGWEDAAVPPRHLGGWMREFDRLLREFGFDAVPYGHFGDGCLHVRIDFPFAPGVPASSAPFREFLEACADRLRDFGGSLSGEHGDGRARSELLSRMYGAEDLALFGQVKDLCDPAHVLNPGNLVSPVPFDADLRPTMSRTEPRTTLRLERDAGSLATAVHRCSGVGRCVSPAVTTTMCPSFLATRQERDSTRGRARVLQEAISGGLKGGIRAREVLDVLDLCLACKGCASDCPTGVDMATYKSEVLHHTYRRRLRPRSHYALGRLPAWARLAVPLAPLVNSVTRARGTAALMKWIAGVDRRRSLPTLARRPLRREAVNTQVTPDLWIWADSFTNHFYPQAGKAAIQFFAQRGLRASVIPRSACCGLTWVTTGQLERARKIMDDAVSTLAPYVDSGQPVLGLEPSCVATLRSDLLELSTHPKAERVSAAVNTMAEVITRLDLALPDLQGVQVVAQPHCHHASVLGWQTDEDLLRRAGADVTRVAGCCGLAGNFGVERGHYEVSSAIAKTHLLPAVEARPAAVVLADGMSCRLQLSDLASIQARHLAELLAEHSRPTGDAEEDGVHA